MLRDSKGMSEEKLNQVFEWLKKIRRKVHISFANRKATYLERLKETHRSKKQAELEELDDLLDQLP